MADPLHTTEILARALEQLNDPALADMITHARQGHYHDFLSPLTFPELQLVTDLRAAGHEALAQRVRDGEFDASAAESEEWARGPDGQETVAALINKPHGQPRAPAS